MPLYDYQCSVCQKVTEVRHGFDDVHSEPCPSCGGALKRVFNPAPILFKGSGFYVTDSRKSSTAASAEKSSSDSKPEVKPADTSSAPAAATPATPAPAAAAPSPAKNESAA